MSSRIDLDKVAALPTSNAYLQQLWGQVRQWLENPKLYDAVPIRSATDCRTPNMAANKHDVQQLLQDGVIREIRSSEVLGTVQLFDVVELAKRRRRPIKHTVDANIALRGVGFRKLSSTPKSGICGFVHDGEFGVALDMRAYYDQFTYVDEVARRFCFCYGGKYFCLNTLAMGQCQACEVAQTCTDILVDFPDRRSTRVASIIDNVVFIGTREDVLHDAARFIERVAFVGGSLNEIDVSTWSPDQLEAICTSSMDFGGIVLDLGAKTVRMKDKTVDKLAISWANRCNWSWRQYAAHMGLLFWSWNIIEVHPSHYFAALRLAVHAGTLLTADPDKWDDDACIWSSAWPQLKEWTELAIANRPRVVPRSRQPDLLVVTDASRWGWGFVAFDSSSGDLTAHSGQWPWYYRRYHAEDLRHSTFAEPQAIVLALERLLQPGVQPRSVRLWSDSVVAVCSAKRGFNAHSFWINDCQRRIQQRFGPLGHSFEFLHVSGVLNIADALSRGTDATTFLGVHSEAALKQCLIGMSVGMRGECDVAKEPLARIA